MVSRVTLCVLVVLGQGGCAGLSSLVAPSRELTSRNMAEEVQRRLDETLGRIGYERSSGASLQKLRDKEVNPDLIAVWEIDPDQARRHEVTDAPQITLELHEKRRIVEVTIRAVARIPLQVTEAVKVAVRDGRLGDTIVTVHNLPKP